MRRSRWLSRWSDGCVIARPGPACSPEHGTLVALLQESRSQQAHQFDTARLDLLLAGARVVAADHIDQRLAEVALGVAQLLVDVAGIELQARGDLTRRQTFAEPQVQDLDAGAAI